MVLLHACAHNPTGVDPSEDEWVEISKLFKEEKNLFPFLDSAYQGFAGGDCDKDAFALRMFKEEEMGTPWRWHQSFAKNMGLYGHRVGTLSMVCASKEEEAKVVVTGRGCPRAILFVAAVARREFGVYDFRRRKVKRVVVNRGEDDGR